MMRVGIFAVSLTVSLGWLAAPEMLRAGRDAAAGYIPLPVEVVASPVAPDVATRPTAEGGATALALAAFLVLAFGFGVPRRPVDRGAGGPSRTFERAGARAPLAFVPAPAAAAAVGGGRRFPASLVFVLALGLFLGWMSAPDFVRHHEVSVAALGSATDEDGRASGSGVSSRLMDGFSSWIGPVAIGHAERPYGDVPLTLLEAVPQTTDLLELEVFEDAETLLADIEDAGAARPALLAEDEPSASRFSTSADEADRSFEPARPRPSASGTDGRTGERAPVFMAGSGSGTGSVNGSDSAGAAPAAPAEPGTQLASNDGEPRAGEPPPGPGGSDPDNSSNGGRGTAGLVDVQPVLGEIFVRFEDAAAGTAIADLLSAIGGEISQCFDSIDDCVVKVSTALDPRQLARDLSGQPTVAAATPNWVRRPADSPRDTLFPLQWSLRDLFLGKDISALRGWAAMGGVSAKANIALLDTAVDTFHPDLSNVIKDAKPVSGGIGSLPDHGTNVAGVLAAQGDSFGISGVNRSWANLYVYDVFSTITVGGRMGDVAQVFGAKDSDIVAAIDLAKEKGVRVVNMSFAGREPARQLCETINNLPGILFVAAAGNGGSSNDHVFPANCASNNVIAVASLDRTGQLAATSNHGDWVEIAAPGELILTTAPGASYVAASGTSMAAPHVAGVASMMFAKSPSLDPATVRQQLMARSDSGRLGIGGGRLNACKALGGSDC